MRCTWGVYLLHPLYINLAVKLLRVDLLGPAPYARLGAMAAAAFGLSVLSVCILRRIPLVKKLF